jgi:hypothetical protein
MVQANWAYLSTAARKVLRNSQQAGGGGGGGGDHDDHSDLDLQRDNYHSLISALDKWLPEEMASRKRGAAAAHPEESYTDPAFMHHSKP